MSGIQIEGDQPSLPPGILLIVGDVPPSAALDFARDVAAIPGERVEIIDNDAEPEAVAEGLPVTIEVDPHLTSDN